MSTMHPPSFLTSRCNKCFGLWLQAQRGQDARESPDGAYSYVIDGPCPMSSLSNVSDLKHDNEEETCSSEGPERDILMEFGNIDYESRFSLVSSLWVPCLFTSTMYACKYQDDGVMTFGLCFCF